MAQQGKETWMPGFIDALKEEMSVCHACNVVGIGRSTVYRHRNSDEAFRAAWDGVVVDLNDRLEASALKRAIDGWEEPVYYKGEVCGEVLKFSDTLSIFMLKNRVPRYRERKPDDPREISIDLGSLDSIGDLKSACVGVALAMGLGQVSTQQGEKLLSALDQVRKTFVTGELAEQLSEILKAQGVDDTE